MNSMTSVWWHLARGRGARWGVVALWVLGAVLSYSALRDLAVMLGFPTALGDLFPLVIDVAVWVGSMNALEAREHGRRFIERYAWGLVALYSSATVAGNARCPRRRPSIPASCAPLAREGRTPCPAWPTPHLP